MKTHSIYSYFALLIIIVISGCEDYLTLENKNTPNVSNYYKTEEDFNTAMVAVYDLIQEKGVYGWWVTGLHALRSDEGYPRQYRPDHFVGELTYWYVIGRNNIMAQIPWEDMYGGVMRANTLLSKLGEVELDDAFETQVEAETRFLRAIFHYHIVMTWGHAPYFESAATTFEDAYLPLSPPEVFWESIIEDMKFAMEHLPQGYQGADVYRPTVWAARAMLARFYLTLAGDARDGVNRTDPDGKSYWQMAKDLATNVIENGPFSLAEDYADLFLAEDAVTDFNSENIFEISNVETSSTGGVYDAESSELNHYMGWWKLEGNEFYEAVTPKQEFIDAHEPGDSRLHTNVMLPGDTLINRGSFDPGAVLIFDRNEEAEHVLWPEPYCVKKWYYGRTIGRERTGTNFPVIRLAEVYLILAEAENELNGPTGIAYDAINEVRNRAGLSNLQDKPGWTPSREALREQLMWERKTELYLEGQRYYDLKRTGTFLEVMNADRQGDPFWEGDLTVDNLEWYFPESEILNNPNIEQKPGW